MKHLSREERIGAVILAVVTLLIISGAFLMRNHSRNVEKGLPEVTVIRMDSTDRKVSSKKIKKTKKDTIAGKQHRKGKVISSKSGNSKGKGNSAHFTPRDPLSDTIPTP